LLYNTQYLILGLISDILRPEFPSKYGYN